MKLNPTAKDGLGPGGQDEEKAFEELNIEPELGGKVDVAARGQVDVERVRQHTAWQRQPHSSQQQPTRKKKGQVEREKGQGERESGERGKRKEQEEEKKETGEEEKEAEEGGDEQVEKDVTGWTEVTRKRRRKTAQIFVKVNGSKATPTEVSLTDDKVEDVMRQVQKDEDVYVTMQGKALRMSDELKSCGVTDGCTIQVTSRVRGGGKHKEKKSKGEKKRAAKPQGPEQKSEEETMRDKDPVVEECDRDAVVQMIEESEENRRRMVRMLEENEDNRKMIESICDGSDVDVEQALQNYRTAGREVLGWDQGQADLMERGLGWAVEARRKERREEHKQRRQEEQEQIPEQELGEEERPLEETRAESTDEPEVTGGPVEVRTGSGSAGLVRGGDGRHLADESNRTGKGKGNGRKGEHGSKGGTGSKGTQQVENFSMDEDQENTRTMKDEREEEEYRWDVRRKVVRMMKREEDLEGDEEDERGRVAPNMGAGGSHTQATSDPRKKKKETRVLRWADCNDEEVKENEEEVEEEKEIGQWEMTDEGPPGLEKEVESEPKTQQEEEPSQVESEQEVQEEEERRAQEARELKRVQEAREEERRAQEAREEERRAQEVKAQDGHESKVKAQGGQEEDVNSVHDESHVSNRHMTWWQNAWWVRVDNGPHMRSAKGRRRTWRAAREAAEQVRRGSWVGETRGGDGKGERREKGERRGNEATLHLILHLPATTQQQPQQQQPQQQQQHVPVHLSRNWRSVAQ